MLLLRKFGRELHETRLARLHSGEHFSAGCQRGLPDFRTLVFKTRRVGPAKFFRPGRQQVNDLLTP